jgi:hypothetical protein
MKAMGTHYTTTTTTTTTTTIERMLGLPSSINYGRTFHKSQL